MLIVLSFHKDDLISYLENTAVNKQTHFQFVAQFHELDFCHSLFVRSNLVVNNCRKFEIYRDIIYNNQAYKEFKCEVIKVMTPLCIEL